MIIISLLQAFTLIFIVYEIIKITRPERIIEIASATENYTSDTLSNSRKAREEVIGFQALFIVELFYLFYVVFLFFTPYWYVALLMITVSLVFAKKDDSLTIIGNSTLSILVLLLIFI